MMKQTVKTSRAAGYLEKMFRVLNERDFDGQLDEPIITIQSTQKAYGYVAVSKVWHKGTGEECHELNIGAGTLDRNICEVVATLIHEQVHLLHLKQGIQDCSRGGVYHNKIFCDAAEARDLKISYDPRIGWSITEPTEALIQFVIEQGWDDIQIGRKDSHGKDTGLGKKPSSTRKLICPQCCQSVRATKKVNILCGDCMLLMVEVE